MNHNKIESDAYLARHARRSASNEAFLFWMLSWGVFTVVSFPIRWELGLTVISIPMAVVISLALSGLVGVVWYARAKRDIDGARALQNERRIEMTAKMRQEHLEKLKSDSGDK
ncbi:hypothetical protein [Aliiroseovarius marinus]|uniref:hypothetical protein n=1 Tax=Aliiroseovarius marinus TaxID=2500159 RepID=UPI003D7C889F